MSGGFYFLKFGISAGNVVRTKSSLFEWLLLNKHFRGHRKLLKRGRQSCIEFYNLDQKSYSVTSAAMTTSDSRGGSIEGTPFPHYSSVEENTEDTVVLLLHH